MRAEALRLALVALALIGGSSCDFSSVSLSVQGAVVDAQTDAPLAGIPVTLIGGSALMSNGQTRSDGTFSLVDPGTNGRYSSDARYTITVNAKSPYSPYEANPSYGSASFRPERGRSMPVVRLSPPTR